MNTHTPTSRLRFCCLPARMIQSFLANISHGGQLLRAGLLMLLLALAGGARAQQFTNDCLIVICPPPLVTNYTCTDVFVPQQYPVVVSNRCPTQPVAVACQPPPGSPLGLGAHGIICTVLFGDSFVGQCHFTVVVVRDTVPPTIDCPTNITVGACPDPTGNCGAVVNYPPPVASDNSGQVAVTCVPASGTFFHCGVTPVVCTAEDRCANKTSCTFTVTVLDGGLPPDIRCPEDMTVTTCSNCAPVIYPAPVVINGALVSCNPPSGACLPIGTTTVTCVAANPCGTVECQFRITVRPVPSAVIECPTNLIVVAPCASNCVPVFYPTPTVMGGTLVGCNPPSGTCLPVGIHPVICRATNQCGDVAGCTFDVRVVSGQGEPPVIQCPPNGFTVTTCSNCAIVNFPPPAVHNGALVKCDPPSGTCFPIGVTFVICTATNPCGSAVCEFPVIVRPVPPAVIDCPTNVVVVAPCSSNCVPVFYPPPTVTGGTLVGCNPPSGACLPVGLHPVVCRATNGCGDVAACTFEIRVVPGQGEPPVILCPADITVTTCSNCAPVTYPMPAVHNGMLIGCAPPSGSCFPLGVTTVTCRATNACGSSECKFDVVVRPVPPPVIQCPTIPVVLTVPCDTNCVPLAYPMPVVLSGALVDCHPPPGTCLPPGNYFVICRATNVCGQVAGCEFPVQVLGGNGEPPLIRCPDDIIVTTCSNNCQFVHFPAPVVQNGSVDCVPPSFACFPIGSTLVTCVASNACGRTECTFKITVRAVPRVDIHCPSNIVVTTCANGEVVHYPPPTLSSSVDPAGISITCTPPSGSFFPVGTNRVICCVVDPCQRTNCCDFLVIVHRGSPCVKPPLNMVLWLPFDEPAGLIAHNIVAGAPNGGHINGPAPVLGQYVLNSLGFDGLNDFVRVPNYAAIVLSGSDFTIDAWVLRRDDGGRRVIVSKVGVNAVALGPRGYEFYLNNGLMNLFLGGPVAQNFNSGVVVPLDNNWHHVAVTVRRGPNGVVRFYLDGGLVNTQGGPITAPIGNSSSLFVGAGTFPGPNSYFRGFIDEVEIFNRVLPAPEIAALAGAKTAGKCKIKCSIPWDVPFPPGVNCVTVQARICNNSGVPMPIAWTATGPMPIPTPNGSFILPPFGCTNVPIQLCRPTNGVPVGSIVRWALSVFPGTACPLVCTGSVINPGPIIVRVPPEILAIPGTNNPGVARIGLNGLPPGQPIRLRAIGPDMEPDQVTLSLNGLPPGVPWIVGGGFAPAAGEIDVPVRFLQIEPIGLYTVLVETDLDGDGEFDTVSSFDVENPTVPPPTITIEPAERGYRLFWKDEGDGLGVLESAKTVDGPWDPIPGARPGHPVDLSDPHRFFRIAVPTE